LLHFGDEQERLAHKAWEGLGLAPPADLDRVAEKLGIRVHEREFVEQIDGFYMRIPGGPPVIAINTSYTKPLARRRFTLAHEIGHHLMAREVQPGKRLFFFDTASTRRTIVERACDRFAVNLLMPEELIREHYDQLSANPENRAAILADRFGVSYQALYRRLRELGLSSRPPRRR